MLSSYNLKNKQTIQISGLILQYCSATTLYRRLVFIYASQTTQHRAGETRLGVWRRTLTRGSTPLRPCCHGAVLWLLCTSRLLPAPAIFIFFILNLVSYLSRKVFKPFPLWGRYLLRWWEQVKKRSEQRWWHDEDCGCCVTRPHRDR